MRREPINKGGEGGGREREGGATREARRRTGRTCRRINYNGKAKKTSKRDEMLARERRRGVEEKRQTGRGGRSGARPFSIRIPGRNNTCHSALQNRPGDSKTKRNNDAVNDFGFGAVPNSPRPSVNSFTARIPHALCFRPPREQLVPQKSRSTGALGEYTTTNFSRKLHRASQIFVHIT